MPDSAIDYTAAITNISTQSRTMTVRYSTTQVDSSRPDIAKIIYLEDDQFNDSDIQIKIKAMSRSVVSKWNEVIATDSANPGFDPADFIGDSYQFTYKPYRYDSAPAFNDLRFRIEQYDSESATEIRLKWNVVALDSSELTERYLQLGTSRGILERKLYDDGHLDSFFDILGMGDDISASWDASAGASFNWDSHQIASHGVKNVERVSEGTYRVIFSSPRATANYTVTTAVGAEDYDGVAASPRQLALISRAADSFQVHCERTDDAADEDNSYMAVQVSKPGVDALVELNYRTTGDAGFVWGDSSTEIARGLFGSYSNDSDWAAFWYANLSQPLSE